MFGQLKAVKLDFEPRSFAQEAPPCLGFSRQEHWSAELGQESQASSCLRKGTPLASRVAHGGLRPLVELCVEPAGLCGPCTGLAVPLRVVPSPTGLPSKRGPGLGSFSRADRGIGRSACGPTHVARLEFPRETGLILRCAGKAGNPFQPRDTCRDSRGERSPWLPAREVKSPCEWRGGTRHCSRVMVGESGLEG